MVTALPEDKEKGTMHYLLFLGIIQYCWTSGIIHGGGGLTLGEISVDHHCVLPEITLGDDTSNNGFGGHGWSSGHEILGWDADVSIGHHGSAHIIPVVEHIGIPVIKKVDIPVPHPIVETVPQPYPVPMVVQKPVPYEVIKPVFKTVEKKVPTPVEKIIPVKVEKPVPYTVVKPVPHYVPKPVPIKVPVYKTIVHGKH
ncbi:uncharacterized protein [Prorops nasuta]|uniref:uncharacterized protein n=1 Tax=Prorops nasuta TaxID=863751 RepID=UPI0034CDA7A5